MMPDLFHGNILLRQSPTGAALEVDIPFFYKNQRELIEFQGYWKADS